MQGSEEYWNYEVILTYKTCCQSYMRRKPIGAKLARLDKNGTKWSSCSVVYNN